MIQNDGDLPRTPPGGNIDDEPGVGGQLPHNPEAEDAPLTVRKGQNPANLGDEVPDAGDVVFPVTEPQPAEI